MLFKFKQWLGIEGVKVELLLPESISKEDTFVDGRIVIGSKNEQTVTSLKLKMFERYTRGRNTEQKIDEYQIGELFLEKEIRIPADTPIYIDFALPFSLLQSNMDTYGDKNILTKAISSLAKTIHYAQSEYRVEVTTTVRGTALNPFDKKGIDIN